MKRRSCVGEPRFDRSVAVVGLSEQETRSRNRGNLYTYRKKKKTLGLAYHRQKEKSIPSPDWGIPATRVPGRAGEGDDGGGLGVADGRGGFGPWRARERENLKGNGEEAASEGEREGGRVTGGLGLGAEQNLSCFLADLQPSLISSQICEIRPYFFPNL
jgi:hypothetical protein